MNKLTIVVTGTRTDARKGDVTRTLNAFADLIDFVYVGDATGVDAEALAWAQAQGIGYHVHYADWVAPDGSIDRSAGPRRNGRMLDDGKETDSVVFAFPHPDPKRRRGTDDCIRQAKARGMVVLVCG